MKYYNLSFANLLSFLPFLYFTIIIGVWIFHKLNIIKQTLPTLYIVGIIFTTVTAQIFKYSPYPNIIKPYSVRPKGACGCDYLSIKGNVEGVKALPSGHMATTGYFVVYNILAILKYIHKDTIKMILIGVNLLFLLLMGWARYIKKCHNLLQIISGSIYGGFIGYLFFKI